MAINKASLIEVEANQLPDATTMVSLATSLKSGGVTQTPRILGPEFSIMGTKAVAIKAVVVAFERSLHIIHCIICHLKY